MQFVTKIDKLHKGIQPKSKIDKLYESIFKEGLDNKNKKLNYLRKRGNIITFKKPIFGGNITQTISMGIEKDKKTGAIKLIGKHRDSPWFNSEDDLIKAVDWNYTDKSKKESISKIEILYKSLKEEFKVGDMVKSPMPGLKYKVIKIEKDIITVKDKNGKLVYFPPKNLKKISKEVLSTIDKLHENIFNEAKRYGIVAGRNVYILDKATTSLNKKGFVVVQDLKTGDTATVKNSDLKKISTKYPESHSSLDKLRGDI